MKVLLVGSGGREHALAWRLRQDDPSIQIFAAPGNPGIAQLGSCVAIPPTDVDGLLGFVRGHGVDWTLVGPEAALAVGIVDAFRAAGEPIFGPTQAAAQLETSKAFSKTLMFDASVPTARATMCSTAVDAIRAIDELGAPVVIKASGLAAGKGVIVCETVAEARRAVRAMLDERSFGAAGDTVLVEEFMEGEELSLFVVTDGANVVALPPAQDHKRLLDGDLGPNTGGMGAYCPVSLIERSPELIPRVLDRIVRPTLAAMRGRGTPFVGLLYVGLMITQEGPKVVEFNVRFGDPETQAVLPAIAHSAPVAELMRAVAMGETISESTTILADRAAVTTVVAASGYPASPRTGDRIVLPTSFGDDVIVFHAGTKTAASGELLTAGGRVLAVTGLGSSIDEARTKSLDAVREIEFADKQFRSDVGWREMARRAGAA